MNATPPPAGCVAQPTRDRIVVAVDGSAADGPAMRWATAEAAARRAALRVVSFVAGSSGAAAGRDRLLAEAAISDLVIVGAATPGAATSWLQTCVARGGSRRTRCPVVVVRGDAPPPARRILVGADSPADPNVVDWATEEAARHAAELVIVHAWPPVAGRSTRTDDLARADARCGIDLAVRRCRSGRGGAVRGALIDGDAATVLSEASRDADLLVVGARGRRGFTTMLLGAVAGRVVEAASCPVVLVPPRVASIGPRSVPDPAALGRPDGVWV